MVEKVGKTSAQLLLLKEINEEINRGEHLDTVLQKAVAGVGDIFGYAACDVFLFEDENTLRYTALAVDSKITKAVEKLVGLNIIGYKIPLFEGSCFKEVIDTKSPIVLDDMVKVFKDFFAPGEKKGKFAPAIARICGFKNALRVPLVSNNDVIGVLGAATNEDISDEDLQVLLLFASHLAVIVQRRQAEEALQVANINLERRVEERTFELSTANKELLEEIAKRELAEEGLRASEEKYQSLKEYILQIKDLKPKA